MITIATWNKCNNNCVMCTNPPGYKDDEGYDYNDLVGRYDKRLDAGEKEIYLTGGEPTIHPHFIDFLDFLRKKCPRAKITVVTNGRLCGNIDFAQKILKRGNIGFQIAVHGQNAFLHDKITGAKGSFEQTIKGIENLIELKSPESEIELRIVIHRLNLSRLKDIYSFLIKTFPGADRIVFIFMEMEGIAGVNIKRVGIRYREVLPYLEKISADFKTSPMEIRLYHFPLCVLLSKFWSYAWRTLPEEEVIYLTSCYKCRYKDYCMGIHKLYVKYMNIGEFRPLKEKNLAIEAGESFYHPIRKIRKICF